MCALLNSVGNHRGFALQESCLHLHLHLPGACHARPDDSLRGQVANTDLLAQAIKATFERRGMAILDALPVGLTDEFAHDASRQALWLAFLKKNGLPPEPLADIVRRLSTALEPVWNTVAR